MKTLWMILLSLLSVSAAYAGDYFGSTHLVGSDIEQATIYGPAELEHVKADTLNVNGPLKFKDLEVTNETGIVGPVKDSEKGKLNDVKVMGPFEAKDVICHNLSVVGPATVTSLLAKGNTEIMGPLKADKSHFQKLTVTADETELKNSEVGDILIKTTSNKEQTLYLDKTIVKGNITFESGRGVIIEKGKAEIKGKVTGGTIKKK
ncbi:MAG: hypothetical protein EPO11_05565 [Gammaproteobacteria bacterium]|nr:MAG: hypothetical protein EPO11_05565 [Gammaproteobacteria bacterium]